MRFINGLEYAAGTELDDHLRLSTRIRSAVSCQRTSSTTDRTRFGLDRRRRRDTAAPSTLEMTSNAGTAK